MRYDAKNMPDTRGRDTMYRAPAGVETDMISTLLLCSIRSKRVNILKKVDTYSEKVDMCPEKVDIRNNEL